MSGRPPLDPFKDFTPVGRVMRDHWIVAVSPALGVNSLAELVALGNRSPGALTFPSVGRGHLAASPGRAPSHARGLRGDARAVQGQPDARPDRGPDFVHRQSSAAVASLIKSGKLKGLAVLSTERMAALPDVPTSAEAGMADLVYNAGICLYAPGGTPRDVVMRLNAALNRAEQSDAVKTRFGELGVETVQGSPDDTAELHPRADGARRRPSHRGIRQGTLDGMTIDCHAHWIPPALGRGTSPAPRGARIVATADGERFFSYQGNRPFDAALVRSGSSAFVHAPSWRRDAGALAGGAVRYRLPSESKSRSHSCASSTTRR